MTGGVEQKGRLLLVLSVMSVVMVSLILVMKAPAALGQSVDAMLSREYWGLHVSDLVSSAFIIGWLLLFLWAFLQWWRDRAGPGLLLIIFLYPPVRVLMHSYYMPFTYEREIAAAHRLWLPIILVMTTVLVLAVLRVTRMAERDKDRHS